MSVKWLEWAIQSSCRQPTEALVLLLLANHATPSGEAWPGYKKLSSEARIKRRQLSTILNRLTSQGLISFGRKGKLRKFVLNHVQSTAHVQPSAHVRMEHVQSTTEHVQSSAKTCAVAKHELCVNRQEPSYRTVEPSLSEQPKRRFDEILVGTPPKGLRA